MAGDVRERMIAGAIRLLARHGLQATSFAEVIELTGAPRGSVYHHFPDGKDQMIGAAVDLAGANALAALADQDGLSPATITLAFLGLWRRLLEASQFQAGCAVVAVTVATDSPDLLQHAGTVFRTWRQRLAELFEQGGLSARAAEQFAAMLVAASEGAIVLSRAERSFEPFDLVADQLLAQLQTLSPPADHP